MLRLLTTFCLLFGILQAQLVDENYFRSPVDIGVLLSGTFGEPRATHFHAGIDIKTEGVEGKKIYAVADGYVSRLKVSPSGYGNVIYITHPNGYVSVYAHLQKFSPEVARFAREKQFEQKSFEIDLEKISPQLLPVKKGDVIALSGNSGSSGGPHLHFEIRDTSDKVYNPLLFGFDKFFKDNIAPSIASLVVYNQDSDRHFTDSKMLTLTSLGGNSFKVSTPVVVNRKTIGLGVQTSDQQNNTHHKNGIYELRLLVDDKPVYHFKMNEFTFNTNRSVFIHCDYKRRVASNQIIHKCFREKGNPLNAYLLLLNNGLITLSESGSSKVTIEILDFHKNTSTITLELVYEEKSGFFKEQKTEYTEFFAFDKRNTVRREKIEVQFPKETFFDDVYFHFKSEEKTSSYSDWYYLHHHFTPVWNYFDIRIKLNNYDEKLTDKYLIVYKNSKGGIVSAGGTFEEGYIAARSRSLGLHYVAVDTTAPLITLQNIYNNKVMTNLKSITLKTTDNLSGIKEYNAFVNGEWVLLEYDAKSNNFVYHFDENVLKGDNLFEVIISDARNNASSVSVNFKY